MHFGLQNIRRLTNISPVNLRRINILVGKNSSGKSTFLRSLPLLRQSITTRTSSPILWYGDLVDFGSFDSVVGMSEKKEITFNFKIPSVGVEEPLLLWSEYSNSERKSLIYSDIDYSVTIGHYEGRDFVRNFRLSSQKPNISFSVDVDHLGKISKFDVVGSDGFERIKDVILRISATSILPSFGFYSDVNKTKERLGPFFKSATSPMMNMMSGILKPHISKKIKESRLSQLAFSVLNTQIERENIVESLGNVRLNSWKHLMERMAAGELSDVYNRIRVLSYMYLFPSFANECANVLKNFLAGVLYIGPVRAKSERYYRYQNLAIDEIDPDGKNFPMFLYSLSTGQRNEFSQWVSNLFGYGVMVEQSSGHISINLVENNKSTNIVDSGYGISQILPVLGQIWWATKRSRLRSRQIPERNVSILAIEQPELHLHPAHQALIADALVNEASSKRDNPITYVIETHSETLVNRLGQLIYEGKIQADDVHVLIFEADDFERTTTVRISEFGQDGSLVNWPYGFFQASV